ncbi:MAG: bifunctional metallophosphatase/5'-nucleotidase [Kiritimatiellia bacterium]|jgi:hypothetical protein|nr:bifunctional metallophosphatase/5'-nucleotidase [Kiritimatiellia bacterium]MDP6847783.1 bifunctional metallophosphatase/5'-nucleotidase [Kiritimatiellia bacterium]
MQNATPIYIDFDDVLCETARALSALLEREFGKSVAFEDIFTFDLQKSFDLTTKELEHLMLLGHEAEVLGELDPVDDAIPTLRRWVEGGSTVAIVTGRPASSYEVSVGWLDRHNVPYSDIMFVDKYSRTTPETGPVPVHTLDALRSMDFCLAIDDSPVMIEFLIESMRMPMAVLDRPWNSKHPLQTDSTRRILRCRTWNEIAAAFPTPHLIA